MGTLNLTIEVLNLPLKVTRADLNIFFSYCGTVEKIVLQRAPLDDRNKDQWQSALVTFRQPFAYRTALLLNDAILAGEPIRIVPAKEAMQIFLPAKDIEKSLPIRNKNSNRDVKDNQIEQHISSVYDACKLWLDQVSPPSI